MTKKKEEFDIESFDHLIREIKEAFRKLKAIELVDILDQYKKETNENIVDLFLSWNTFFDKNEGVDEESENKSIPWVEVSSKCLKVSLLLSIEKDKNYDFMRNKNKYEILINRTNSDNTYYGNTILSFSTEKDRDREYNNLKLKLNPHGIKFI